MSDTLFSTIWLFLPQIFFKTSRKQPKGGDTIMYDKWPLIIFHTNTRWSPFLIFFMKKNPPPHPHGHFLHKN